jgi:hypothetical protein
VEKRLGDGVCPLEFDAADDPIGSGWRAVATTAWVPLELASIACADDTTGECHGVDGCCFGAIVIRTHHRSDWNTMMDPTHGEQSDRQLPFLLELIQEKAVVAGDVTQISTHTWAIHGYIPVDGDVIMAEFDDYDQARHVLEELPTETPATDDGC